MATGGPECPDPGGRQDCRVQTSPTGTGDIPKCKLSYLYNVEMFC